MTTTYYKFIGDNRGNYPYHVGLNTLEENNEVFNDTSECCEGGLYFSTIENLRKFIEYGNKVCVVTIPDDATDIKWHNIGSSDQFDKLIRKVVDNFISSGHDMDELQIMAPMYKGNCGVNIINETIQDLMTEIMSIQKWK